MQRSFFTGWLAAGLVLAVHGPVPIQAETEPPAMQSGGAQSPVTGGRPDSQEPQLGPGNRGTGQRGAAGKSSLDPGTVRSAPVGPDYIVGQVLSIRDDLYIVRRPDGHEVMLQTDKETDIQAMIRMGAKVEAQVDGTGRVTQLKPAE
jgi:hypothetical protein